LDAKQAADLINADLPIRIDETETPRSYVAKWLQLRVNEPDITYTEAARQLKIGRKTLQAAIAQAVQEGWLEFEDPLAKVEFQIIPKTLSSLNRLLDEGDRIATIETAKGVLFPMFRESKGISDAPQTVLALKIEAPPDGVAPIIQGQIIGTPRTLDTPIKD
jgi:hypothetical protein